MRLRDLFRRPAPSPDPRPQPPPAVRPAWPDLPPVQRVVSAPSLVTAPDRFRAELASWGNPSFLGTPGHLVTADAPSGSVAGLARTAEAVRWDPPPPTRWPGSGPVAGATDGDGDSAGEAPALVQRSTTDAVPLHRLPPVSVLPSPRGGDLVTAAAAPVPAPAWRPALPPDPAGADVPTGQSDTGVPAEVGPAEVSPVEVQVGPVEVAEPDAAPATVAQAEAAPVDTTPLGPAAVDMAPVDRPAVDTAAVDTAAVDTTAVQTAAVQPAPVLATQEDVAPAPSRGPLPVQTVVDLPVAPPDPLPAPRRRLGLGAPLSPASPPAGTPPVVSRMADGPSASAGPAGGPPRGTPSPARPPAAAPAPIQRTSSAPVPDAPREAASVHEALTPAVRPGEATGGTAVSHRAEEPRPLVSRLAEEPRPLVSRPAEEPRPRVSRLAGEPLPPIAGGNSRSDAQPPPDSGAPSHEVSAEPALPSSLSEEPPEAAAQEEEPADAEAPLLGAAPLVRPPVGAVPVGAVPVGAVPVAGVPVGGVPVGGVPVQRTQESEIGVPSASLPGAPPSAGRPATGTDGSGRPAPEPVPGPSPEPWPAPRPSFGTEAGTGLATERPLVARSLGPGRPTEGPADPPHLPSAAVVMQRATVEQPTAGHAPERPGEGPPEPAAADAPVAPGSTPPPAHAGPVLMRHEAEESEEAGLVGHWPIAQRLADPASEPTAGDTPPSSAGLQRSVVAPPVPPTARSSTVPGPAVPATTTGAGAATVVRPLGERPLVLRAVAPWPAAPSGAAERPDLPRPGEPFQASVAPGPVPAAVGVVSAVPALQRLAAPQSAASVPAPRTAAAPPALFAGSSARAAGLPAAAPVWQRSAEAEPRGEQATEPAEPPAAATVSRLDTGDPGTGGAPGDGGVVAGPPAPEPPPAGHAAAALAAGAASPPPAVDAQVQRLFDPLTRQFKAELRLDRERVGHALDLRY